MADDTGPILLVAGADPKRLQWLTHHVTSQWPDAQVHCAPADDSITLERLAAERSPDALFLQMDFGRLGAVDNMLAGMSRLLRVQPELYCIVLAQNGNESAAVRAMKCGAKDYLPLAAISRDALLAASGK